MRYLVYLLLLANLVVFAWQRISPEPETVVLYPLATPPGIDRLVLLSERDKPAMVAGQSQQPQTTGEEPPAVELIEPPAVEGPEAVPQAAVPEPVCQTVGPFLDKKDVTSTYTLLVQQGYIVSIRDGDVREPNGYWVYLPAMPASQARSIVADLDAHGMKDYFIGKQNHISLGIFSDADKARIRQKTVKKLGYDAVLDPRFRMRDVFWLDVEESGQALLSSDIWQKIQAEHSDIRVQKVSCE